MNNLNNLQKFNLNIKDYINRKKRINLNQTLIKKEQNLKIKNKRM